MVLKQRCESFKHNNVSEGQLPSKQKASIFDTFRQPAFFNHPVEHFEIFGINNFNQIFHLLGLFFFVLAEVSPVHRGRATNHLGLQTNWLMHIIFLYKKVFNYYPSIIKWFCYIFYSESWVSTVFKWPDKRTICIMLGFKNYEILAR